MLEYAVGGSTLFTDAEGFSSPLLDAYRGQAA
jgi:hypothetical protein